ncbi:MAG: GNAT family N-acetyltransferase [Mycobacteriales bacterium]|nr:GNAT family N-acetyltransferase [Mycobacteriales bacterium]
MRIEQVDPRDDEAFGRWYAVLAAVEQDTRPGESGWTAQDQREIAVTGLEADTATGELVTLLLAVDGARDVGLGRLVLTTRDNLDRARVLVHVLPDERRGGVGTALLEGLLARARAAGRSVAGTEVDEPEALAGVSPAHHFLTRHGFDRALLEVRRDLAVPVPSQVLAGCLAHAREGAAGYDVTAYSRRCPDHLLDARAALGRAMSVMFPSGDLELEEEQWDAELVRRKEAMFDRMGRVYWAAMATRDGEAVAFTELGVSSHAPDRAYQWDTLVLPEHRGHRLGLLLKATVLGQLQTDSPATRTVTTWNATTNAPMIAVNERLGFRPNGTLSTWQKRL